MKINRVLLKGSIVLLITFGLFNLFNFLFQWSMVRLLSPSDFGSLATLFAIISILGVFTDSIQTVITKYVSNEKENSKIKGIIFASFKNANKLAFALLIIYLIIMVFLFNLLKIDYLLLAFNGLIIFTAFFIPITRGVMQGKKKFAHLGINMVLESATKFILALGFVFLGWKVYGAIFATFLSVIIAFVFSFIPLKSINKSRAVKKANIDNILSYTGPTFAITLAITLFYSLDIIMAKVFFSEEIAGFYAISSTLAKIIFLGTLPISKAMFPLSAEDKSPVYEKTNVFLNALGILGGMLIVGLSIFYAFPDLIILTFKGEAIVPAARILFYLAIAASLLSLANLTLLYKLSTNKTSGYFSLLFFVMIEVILLSYFSSNLIEFSFAFIFSSAAFLWASIVLIK